MRLTELLTAPGRRAEPREFRYRHVLGPGASPRLIDEWQQRHPRHPLPADLRDLLLAVNGIHLWANAETGRSYTGLAPLEEWELTRTKMYGAGADPSLLDDRYMTLSYHQDGAAYVVLDAQTGQYFLMDASGPDTTSPVARHVSGLLDWLWFSRVAPKA
jgi:hypothetical protein